MRVLVCGSRDWTDAETIWVRLNELHARLVGGITCIIEGEARGADIIAGEWAQYLAIPYLPYPANWNGHHRAAGAIRNRQMLAEGKPDLVVAFHEDIGASKGTKDMIDIARKAGLPVLLYAE